MCMEPCRVRRARRAEQLCRHCRVRPVSRTRGLCWGCFYNPSIRDLYPSTSKFGLANRGICNGHVATVMPTPTTARPGTPEKVAVMQARALARQELFHPHDAAYRGEILNPANVGEIAYHTGTRRSKVS